MIDRPEYLKKLISWKDKKLVKIITGVRRSGKSTLFMLYQDYLLANGVKPAQIINLNMEDPSIRDLLVWDKLYDFINAKLLKSKKNYVFIDEVQNVKDFQRAADGLFIKDNVDLYLTGSNSHFHAGEWATMLTGRYIEIHIFPLSFKEYVSAYPYNDTRETMFQRYLENSSFPYAMEFTGIQNKWDTARIRDYLGGIYSTIVLRDVMENKNLRETGRLELILKYMVDNIGNLTSIKKISDVMTNDGFKIYPQTIESYLEALRSSYILYRTDRYDIKGKKLLKSLSKYYVVDMGFRYFLLGDRQIDTGRMLENVVYLELLRRNRKVYTGKMDMPRVQKEKGISKEIDFVTENDNGTEYYQVAETVLDKKTKERELSPLNEISDHNPKYLLTKDAAPSASHNGIKQINVFDWLLS
ncbi:MAG: ATP-binding protein [Treponema sp.]|jgi:predicted AAA+ superfamily ATPase|nr:ATP-binding protein [Treponema sp.]